MDTGDAITYVGLEVSVRPPRLAVASPLPDGEWASWSLRVLENFSRVWGGAHDLLFPCSATGEVHPALWRALRLFDADRFGFYVQTYRGLQLSSPDKFEEWLHATADRQSKGREDLSAERAEELLRADHVMSSPRFDWRPPLELNRRILEFMSPHHSGDVVFRHHLGDEWTPGYHYTDMALLEPVVDDPIVAPDTRELLHPLPLLLSMRAGALAPKYADVLTNLGVPFSYIRVDERLLSRWLEFAWLPYDVGTRGSTVIERAVTPLGRTASGCGFFHPVVGWDERVYPVVVGETATDFSLALAYDRLFDGAAWFPPSLLVKDPLRKAAFHALASTLWQLSSPNQLARRIVFTSTSEGRGSLLALERDISKNSLYGTLETQVADAASIDFPDSGQHLWDIEVNRVSRVEPFLASRQATRLETPTPSGVELRRTSLPSETPIAPRYLTWEVDTWVEGRQLVPRSALADLFIEAGGLDRDIRASRDGISYFSQTGFILAGEPLRRTLSRPKLVLPTAVDVFAALLARHGLRCQVSQSGRYLEAMVRMWGGLDNLIEAMRSEAIVRILQEFVAAESEPSDKRGVYLKGLERRFLTFEDMLQVAETQEDSLRRTADEYTTKGILRRGLILKCGTCRFFNWFPIDDVGQTFRCPRCSAVTPITQRAWRQTIEPEWYYQLAEVAFQGVRKNGAATVLALAALKEKTRTFIWAPELLVASEDGEATAEHDIWALVDGSVVVGEANTTGNFGSSPKKRISRLYEAAIASSADEVVLATTAPSWSKAVVSRIRDRFSSIDTRLRWMTSL